MILNANSLPKRYFALHMVPGVAEYNTESFKGRLLIGEEAAKKMDSTFEGKPFYVHHVDGVNLPDLAREMDGVVVKSFFNKADGKHWVEFIATTDRAHQAIAKKWAVSNAYNITESAGGGTWHAVGYEKEVMAAVYEHLACVPDPRYEESIILTPEEFKAYNSNKEAELLRLANSKETVPMFNLFKKTKVENSADFEQMSVTLPKSKKEMTLTQLVTEMDTIQNMNGFADPEHMVKLNGEEMSVKKLADCYNKMKNAEKEKEEAEAKKNAGDGDGDEDDMENGAEDQDDEHAKKLKEAEAKKNAEDEEKAKKEKNSKKNSKNFDAIKNAREKLAAQPPKFIDTAMDQSARGKARYGSQA